VVGDAVGDAAAGDAPGDALGGAAHGTIHKSMQTTARIAENAGHEFPSKPTSVITGQQHEIYSS
jgi:hypothetical protein